MCLEQSKVNMGGQGDSESVPQIFLAYFSIRIDSSPVLSPASKVPQSDVINSETVKNLETESVGPHS